MPVSVLKRDTTVYMQSNAIGLESFYEIITLELSTCLEHKLYTDLNIIINLSKY